MRDRYDQQQPNAPPGRTKRAGRVQYAGEGAQTRPNPNCARALAKTLEAFFPRASVVEIPVPRKLLKEE